MIFKLEYYEVIQKNNINKKQLQVSLHSLHEEALESTRKENVQKEECTEIYKRYGELHHVNNNERREVVSIAQEYISSESMHSVLIGFLLL